MGTNPLLSLFATKLVIQYLKAVKLNNYFSIAVFQCLLYHCKHKYYIPMADTHRQHKDGRLQTDTHLAYSPLPCTNNLHLGRHNVAMVTQQNNAFYIHHNTPTPTIQSLLALAMMSRSSQKKAESDLLIYL